jgi:DNA primase
MAGMEVPSEGPAAAERRRTVQGVQETLAAAAAYFETQLRLPVGREALAYLRGRGLDDVTIRRFRLGYAPGARGSLAAGLAREGVQAEQLVEAGLLKRRDDGSLGDYFRDRAMFPITDRQGHVIAFGGRALGDIQPKYLNSPETAAFQKGHVLYGLAQAREPAHKTGRLLVVEGYMDVIALAQAGIAEAVAPLGTALGEEQIRLLWSLAPEPVLCLDGDRAGQAAAIRAAERALPLLQPGRSLRFALLPAGEDPDSLVREAGARAINDLVDAAEPLEHVIWQSEWQRHAPTTPERRAAFHRAVLAQVRRIGDQTVRGYYEQTVRERLRQTFAAAPPPRRAWTPRPGAANGERPAAVPGLRRRPDRRRLAVQRQRVLLGVLALNPVLIPEVAEQVVAMPFADSALDMLRNRIITVAGAFGEINDLDATTLAAQVMATPMGDPLQRRGVDERLWHAVCESGRALLDGDIADGQQEPLMKARRAIQTLIEALEHDPVRAELDGKVKSLAEDPDDFDRTIAAAGVELSRALDRH